MKNQQFQGTAKGFHDKVTATLTIENGRIINVTSNHHPHAYVGSLGIEQVINNIIDSQTVEVDTVSGATFSSNAFIEASKKAFAVYKGDLTAEKALDIEERIVTDSEIDTVSSASINPNKPQENTSVATDLIINNENIKFDATYDVIIAGSGGAGLAAAVEAARSGLNVLICEKAGIAGGTTNYSGGVMQAAGTTYQKEFTEYKDDSTDKHAQLWLKAGEGSLDDSLVNDLAQSMPDNLEWLSEMGLNWTSVYGHAQIPYVDESLYAERIHVYEGGGSAGSGVILTQTLLNAAQEAGATIQYNTALVSLIQDTNSDHIIGAVVSQNDKLSYLQANNGIILATASIDHNPALAKELNPQHFNDLNYNTVLSTKTNTGDGIIIGMSAGAAINGMGGCIDFCGKTGNATDSRIHTFPMIYVNGLGHRFVCEEATYAYTYRAIFQQEKQHNKQTYMIFGESSIQDSFSPWTKESLAKDIESGLVKKASTFEELANIIKVPVENLKKTLKQWNQDVSHGKDTQFGRTQGLVEITGPYYAYHNKASNLGSIGGLKINTDSQVLDNFGQVIPNLYAAGLNTGGWIGGYYPGSGTAISGIVHQGRKAGKAISRK
ncbi:FAD-dependent oxidoreductase [Aerococcaceae bacterium WGS1372]